jgi:hypothetical protein
LRSASDFFRLTTSWLEWPKASGAGRFSPDIIATEDGLEVTSQSRRERGEVGIFQCRRALAVAESERFLGERLELREER